MRWPSVKWFFRSGPNLESQLAEASLGQGNGMPKKAYQILRNGSRPNKIVSFAGLTTADPSGEQRAQEGSSKDRSLQVYSPRSRQPVQVPAQEWLTFITSRGTCIFSAEEMRKDGFGFDRNQTDETCYLNVEMRRLDE